MANPYDIDFLMGLIGQQESQRLEFKSSRELSNETDSKRNKFMMEQVIPAVSAFLNTDGGQLILGLEEKSGVLSEGVARSQMTAARLQSSICSRIQPAVAGYINVFPVPLRRKSASGEELFAFVIDVRPGITAYQSDDRRYYVRRSGQTEAMEDKDIRLRMLAADKPRINVELKPEIVRGGAGYSGYINSVNWRLWFKNVGVINIPTALMHTTFELHGLSEQGSEIIRANTPKYHKTDFPMGYTEHAGLLPGLDYERTHINMSSLAFIDCSDLDSVAMTADITVFIDNGLPAEVRNYDLMADLRPWIIDTNWRTSQD